MTETTRVPLANLLANVSRVDQQEEQSLQDEATAMNAVLTILARQERALVAPQDIQAKRIIVRALQAIKTPLAHEVAPVTSSEKFDQSAVLTSMAKALEDHDAANAA